MSKRIVIGVTLVALLGWGFQIESERNDGARLDLFFGEYTENNRTGGGIFNLQPSGVFSYESGGDISPAYWVFGRWSVTDSLLCLTDTMQLFPDHTFEGESFPLKKPVYRPDTMRIRQVGEHFYLCPPGPQDASEAMIEMGFDPRTFLCYCKMERIPQSDNQEREEGK